ncbi:hypothetical protein PVAP13_5NG170908 [Panicum virgatum]|uniref:Uncharacterized protein n=1 Tax=Panicum virgatum TaxID=38727 RepID=A0A8T0S6T2_PANVG|nr:hypothetical protein PVAP13_5NG170908 [Panicum virgatum]KAG2593324.1 hypothetical protein PVAP13_5NG170908 [Panicum virgatum]
MLEKAKQEVRHKDDSLRKLQGKDQLRKNLQEKVKELEGQIDSKTHSQMTSEKQQLQLSGKLKEKEEMCTALQQKMKNLELKSKEHIRSLELKNKDLELKLKEKEDQQSVAELKNSELEPKLKELEHQRNKEVELKFLRSSNSLNTQQPLIPKTAEAVVNEKKRKDDARNASIVGEQESKRLKKTAAKPPWVVKNLERSKALSRAAAAAAAAATHKVLPTPRSLALNKLNKM